MAAPQAHGVHRNLLDELVKAVLPRQARAGLPVSILSPTSTTRRPAALKFTKCDPPNDREPRPCRLCAGHRRGARIGATLCGGWRRRLGGRDPLPPLAKDAKPRKRNKSRAAAASLEGNLETLPRFRRPLRPHQRRWASARCCQQRSAFEYDDISNISRENLSKLFAVNLHAPCCLARDFAAQLRRYPRV